SPRRRGRGGRPLSSRTGAAAGADRPLPLRPPLGPRQGGVLAVGRPAGAPLHPHAPPRDRRPLAPPRRSAAGRGVGGARGGAGGPGGWGARGVAGLVLDWAGALGGDALVALSHGLMRYPEKLLFWFALAASLLARWGRERGLAPPNAGRGPAAGAGLALAAAAGVFLAGARLAAWLAAGH